MAVHIEEERETSRGLVKEIDASAISLVFDNMQRNQYQYPIPSTIRELTSNAVDSIREKNIALAILSGKAKAEDYYLERDEAMFRDSNFHKEYYNPLYLDAANNTVRIEHRYTTNESTKDMLIISDTGVGLGLLPNPKTGVSRLEGYFKLSYSSKRNTSTALGKYGIGAKAALSTDVDYFTTITRYNGIEYQFNVYSYKVDSITPKFNLATGEANLKFVLNKGTDNEYVIYGTKTDLPNGTEIHVATKKIYRQRVIDAIKTQLLYFKDVEFLIQDEDAFRRKVEFAPEILYEDENLILSNNNLFSKPHLILNGVNYGMVDFDELELAPIHGNIGFKVKPEDVEVNPSRESVIWLGKTKDAVLDSIKRASETVNKIISEKLDTLDFYTWLKSANTLITKGDSDIVLGRFRRIVDVSQLKPVFKGNTKISYSANMFYGIELTLVTKTIEYSKRNGKNKSNVTRTTASISDLLTYPLYFQEGNTSSVKDAYLLEKHQKYVKIKKTAKSSEVTETDTNQIALDFKTWAESVEVKYDLLCTFPDVQKYEDVPVEREFEEEKEKEEAEENLTPDDIRKLNDLILVKEYYRPECTSSEEILIKNILESDATIVYGFQEDRELLKRVSYMQFDKKFKIYSIAMKSARYFEKHTHVKDFISYYDHSTKTIGMHNLVGKAYMASLITDNYKKIRFLAKFEDINPKMYKLFEEINAFRNENAVRYGGTSPEMLDYMGKVASLQLFIEDHKDNTIAIAEKSKELFDFEVEGAIGLDMDIYRKFELLLEYVEPIYKVMDILVDYMGNEGIEPEIREILQYKGIAVS